MSYNEHTGQKQSTKVPSQSYMDNWDRIFGSKVKRSGPSVQTDAQEADTRQGPTSQKIV